MNALSSKGSPCRDYHNKESRLVICLSEYFYGYFIKHKDPQGEYINHT